MAEVCAACMVFSKREEREKLRGEREVVVAKK